MKNKMKDKMSCKEAACLAKQCLRREKKSEGLWVEFWELIVYALEKQIKTKPIQPKIGGIKNGKAVYMCPVCHRTFAEEGVEDYCHICGQEIDWSKQKKINDEEADSLTIEELKHMAGEPVWCPDINSHGIIKCDKVGHWKDIPYLHGSWYDKENGLSVDFEYDIQERKLKCYRIVEQEEE